MKLIQKKRGPPPPEIPDDKPMSWWASRKAWAAQKKAAEARLDAQAAAVRREHVAARQGANRSNNQQEFRREVRRVVDRDGVRGAENGLALSVHLHV